MKKILCIMILVAMVFTGSGAQDHPGFKLFRFGNIGNEKPGVVAPNGKMLDVSAFGEDYNETFFEKDGIGRLSKWLSANVKKCPEVPANTRLSSCVARPSKIVAIGLNYAKHVQEAGATMPSEPVIFMKASSSLCGPNDDVVIPLNSTKTDWEAELAIVIGKKATHVSEADVIDYIAGFTVINDYSERSSQLEGTGQWTKGKSADSFAPLGPYLVTNMSVDNAQNLKIWLKVNGVMLQSSNTNDMIFKIPFLVSYVSRYMTLLPGDVIATGTPSGVGLGLKPARFLKPGDIIELGIENIGEQRQLAAAYKK